MSAITYNITNFGDVNITSLTFSFTTPSEVELHADFSSIKSGEATDFTGTSYTVSGLNMLPEAILSFSVDYTYLSGIPSVVNGSITVTGISSSGESTKLVSTQVNLIPGSRNTTISLTPTSENYSINCLNQSEDFVLIYDTTYYNNYYDTVYVPLKGTFNVTIDWGDGNPPESFTTEDPSHTYSTPGIYTVRVSGSCTAYSNSRPWQINSDTLIAITSWGNLGITDLSYAFSYMRNLAYIAPIPSGVTTLEGAFLENDTFNYDISNWDTSSVTNMAGMFSSAKYFNKPIDCWDVSNVTNMDGMFYAAIRFNQPLNSWNVSNVTSMSSMFHFASAFNQDLNNWDTSSVTDMSYMFSYAVNFNENITSWNTSNVSDISVMFWEATSFNQPIGNWNVSNVVYMYSVFEEATSFNQPLNNWNMSRVEATSYMFGYATSFNQPLNNWNVSNVKEMEGMFYGAAAFNQPLNNWDTSDVGIYNYGYEMAEMFRNASSFNQDISGWCVTNIPYTPFAFSAGCPLLPEYTPIWGTCP